MTGLVIDILAITSGVLVTVGAVYSFLKVLDSHRASRLLQTRLMSHSRDRLELLISQLHNADPDAYLKATRLIEEELVSMPVQDRREIVLGLTQPTVRGRRDYITTVLEKTASQAHNPGKI